MTNNKNKLRVIQFFSVIGFIIAITLNSLASILPLNGKDTGVISDMYPNLFVPTGLTFAIWGLIYIFLLLYTLYQTGVFSRLTVDEETTIKEIGVFYIISCLANAAWIVCWHYGFVMMSVVMMLVILGSLLLIYLQIPARKSLSIKERVFLSAPFSFYLGWITVATIANITALLVDIKWNGWGIKPEIWTVAVIVVAIIITLAIQIKFKDVLYSLVVIWALLGILIKHVDFFNQEYLTIIGTVIAGIVILGIGGILASMNKSRSKR